MKPVMLATDGSPTAALATEKAIELAKATSAPLVVVTVWHVSTGALGYAPLTLVPELETAEREHAEEIVETAVAKAQAAGLEASGFALRGYATEEICRAAEEHDATLIVLGSHGWGPMRRMFFGSVSTGVLHHAPCPVLVVRRTADVETARNGRGAKVEA
jgi:universal stress protein A